MALKVVHVDNADFDIEKISDMDYRVTRSGQIVGDFMVAPNEHGVPSAWVGPPNLDQTMRVAKAALAQSVVPF